MTSSNLLDFKRFMQQRDEVARAYVRGDATPLDRIVAREGEATFFPSGGGSFRGAATVSSTYERDAKAFAPGGDSRFEILQLAASDGMAYWVGFQRANAYLIGRPQEVPFDLRVTEIFRREGESWKLVHRHADPLVAPAEEQT